MTDMEKEVEPNEFDPSIAEEEREFYLKAYPSPEYVRDRKTHCTTCKVHIGTAPCNEHGIKMHPILRVTHCTRCHAFYNSGEFSKGEDGSELYCRWCGQGGEVYCCSNCPYVFCKSCITKNLSRGVVADIEQNENWRCFACAPKILWPLRALHWALMNYIEKQKKEIDEMDLPEADKKTELLKDRSTCCRLAKAKCGNMSDSLESVDSLTSRRSSSSSNKKKPSAQPLQIPPAKRPKTSNDEVVCTPDLLSMLEPDCQITVQAKQSPRVIQPVTTPKIFTVQQNYVQPALQQRNSTAPPPLVLRNTGIQLRPVANPPVIRRTVVSPRTPAPSGSNSPVYHTINGYRIDLNCAAQQGTYRLPNGKLIQVKRQSGPTTSANNVAPSAVNNWSQPQTPQRILNTLQANSTPRTVQITPQRPFVTLQSQSVVSGVQVHQQPQAIRYPSGMIGNTVIAPFNQNGPQIQMINGVNAVGAPAQQVGAAVAVRPTMIRHTFADNQIGQARTRLQDEIFNAMEICQHLTGKLQTLTNSNAYKQARNLMEVKELYIHLSYLLTYAIGRYKGLQDKCLTDMRQLGFTNDADSLENGQIAAGIDYVRYGQLEDVELFTSGSNSFHNQIYEYRKSLLANLDDSIKAPLSPLYQLNGLNDEDDAELVPPPREHDRWHGGGHHTSRTQIIDDDDDDVQEVPLKDEPSGQYMDSFMDEDPQDDLDAPEDDYYGGMSNAAGLASRGTEDVMRREEESHAYDRKLTRLIEQYPSIWCTRHPDYGNFEVTRKQWRTIASHFRRSEDMKMRWKNIRKRYVRIERRMQEGKRFNGYFDKATNFLINRDTPPLEWVSVDCGNNDGDVYERTKLDAIEKELHKYSESDKKFNNDMGDLYSGMESCAPIEIRPLDMKIIHFVKCNPVLWRKSSDPAFHKMDDQTRKSLWMHLWKSVPNMRCEDLIDRWTQLYEMYKTFRLKTIKSENANAALEIKYSKYLAKLYFLYKIDEEELQSEYNELVYGNDLNEDDVESDSEQKLLEMPDDREFVRDLMRTVREYPQIWNPNHVDYHDVQLRDETWQETARRLEHFEHKQASDDEDNEIEIVEPKTDTINLDSDNEDQVIVSSSAKTTASSWNVRRPVTIAPASQKAQQTQPAAAEAASQPPQPPQNTDDISTGDEMTDFMDTAHNILASMLEIDIVEGNDIIMPTGSSSTKKQPRKKTTNKPNPTLVKQKQLMEWQKLEDMKRNDVKLKSKCAIVVKKAEDEFPYTVGILKQRYEKRRETAKRLAAERALKAKENAEKKSAEKKNVDENGTQEESSQLTKDNEIDGSDKSDKTDKTDGAEKQKCINEENKNELTEESEERIVKESENTAQQAKNSEKTVTDKPTSDEEETVDKGNSPTAVNKSDKNESSKKNTNQSSNEKDQEEKVAQTAQEKEKGEENLDHKDNEGKSEEKPSTPATENKSDNNESAKDNLEESPNKNDQAEKLEQTERENQDDVSTAAVTDNESHIEHNSQSNTDKDDESLKNKNDKEEQTEDIAQEEEDTADANSNRQIESKTSPVDNELVKTKENTVTTDNDSVAETETEKTEENEPTKTEEITSSTAEKVIKDNKTKSLPQSSQKYNRKPSIEQEAMETNEKDTISDATLPDELQNESSQSTSSSAFMAANEEQQSSSDSSRPIQEAHTESLEKLDEINDKNAQKAEKQAEDIEMAAESNIDEVSRSSSGLQVTENQNSSTNNEDYDMDSGDHSDNQHFQKHDSTVQEDSVESMSLDSSAVQEDSVEPMNLDTSEDIFSKSSLSIDTTLNSANKDIQEMVQQNSNVTSGTPQAISVVTNAQEQ